MTYGQPDKGTLPSWALVGALLATIPIIWVIVSAVDTATLSSALQAVLDQPLGLLLALAAFASAFLLRAIAWTRVIPDLSLGQSWAGLHMALAGNHILPLRLGEPLRVLSVVRRAGIDWPRATASTMTLRSADLVAIGLIGAVAGLGAFSALWATVGVVIVGVVLIGAGIAWLRRLGQTRDVSLPGLTVIVATIVAWLLEAIVVYQAADWASVDLDFGGAILVTSAAVVAQIAAVAPGGLGTYEAGGVAAMVFLGVDPSVGLAIVLTAHAVKTAYSLAVGVVASVVPSPGMMGRLRLDAVDVTGDQESKTAGQQHRPVVLFMPAHNEGESVGAVVRRVPGSVLGHPVLCLVIDDGSSDRTSQRATAAGATVVRLERNRGLGAAVRIGLAEALRCHPAAIAFCDADGEYSPEELEAMVAPILDGRADYVVGSRFRGHIERMLPHRRLGNFVLTKLLCWVARTPISDGQSGYRAFSPQAAAAAEVIHDFNYAQVLTLDLLAKGVRYVEVPISYSFRTTGHSFIKFGRYLRAVVPAIYREVNAG